MDNMNASAQAESAQAACWICGNREAKPWKARNLPAHLSPDDLKVTDHRYGTTLALDQCSGCGFIYAHGDELPELTALYEQLEDDEYERTQDTRVLQMRWILDLSLRARPHARRVLDIGSGAGLLVAEAKRRGLEAVGVEPSRSLVEVAERVNGVQLLQGTFPHPELSTSRFDVVFLVDVIEHVADPVGLLKATADVLAPGGAVVVVTPDVKSILARLLGQRWWHFRLAHVGYFDRSTLTRALENAQLTPVRWWRAKWFFRVEYLAERLGVYLPIQWFNRIAGRSRVLRAAYQFVVPVNLHDSWVVLAAGGAHDQDR
jgi:2-polyprenyl-3-methyl-5-hydroxy-6-metoxy-1,4-benzoquinol methylase